MTFLRKKFTLDSRQSSPNVGQDGIQGQQPWSSSSTISTTTGTTPLYAKFAIGQAKPTAGQNSRIVSAPMPLSNGNRRKTQSSAEHSQGRPQKPPNQSTFATARDDEQRMLQRLPQIAQTAVYDHQGVSAYPQQRQPQLPVMNANVVQDRSQQPSSRPLSILVDKPLPLPNPEVNTGPLNSSPQPAAVPANRRTSALFVSPSSKALPILTPTPSSTYSEKPLPQPQITPPAISSSQPVDRYFESHNQPDTNRDGMLPSTPIKHVHSYPFIVPGSSAATKDLPPQPQGSLPSSSVSTPVLAPPIALPSKQLASSQTTHLHKNRHQRQPADFDTIYDAYTHFTDVPDRNPITRTEQSLPKLHEPVNGPVRPLDGPQSLDIPSTTANIHNQYNTNIAAPLTLNQHQAAWLPMHAEAFGSTSQSLLTVNPSASNVSLSHTNVSAEGTSSSSLPIPVSTSDRSRQQLSPPPPPPPAPTPGPIENTPEIDASRSPEPAFRPVLPLQPRKAMSMRTPDNTNGQFPRITPTRGKPLIFAAMATMDQVEGPKPFLPMSSAQNQSYYQFSEPVLPSNTYPISAAGENPKHFPPMSSAQVQSYYQPNESVPSSSTYPTPVAGENYARPSQQPTDANLLYPHVINSLNPARHPSLRLFRRDEQHPTVYQPPINNTASTHINSMPTRPSPSRKLSKTGPILIPTPPPAPVSAPPTATVPLTRTPPPRTPSSYTPDPEQQRHPSASRRSSQSHSPHRLLTKARVTGSKASLQTPPAVPDVPGTNAMQPSNEPDRNRSITLPLLDDDPFARTDGVKVLKPSSRDGLTPPSRDGTSQGVFWGEETRATLVGAQADRTGPSMDVNRVGVRIMRDARTPPAPVTTPGSREAQRSPWEEVTTSQPTLELSLPLAKTTGGSGKQEIKEVQVASDIQASEQIPTTLIGCLSQACVLETVLSYLTFVEWSVLSTVSRELRSVLQQRDELREVILERYLSTVGYRRWLLPTSDPLPLSLNDLNNYMHGVSIPTHEYARIAQAYLQSLSGHGRGRGGEIGSDTQSLTQTVEQMTASTHAYTRVVLRLRAQAESEPRTRKPSEVTSRPASAGRGAANGQGQISSPPPSWNNGSGNMAGSMRAPSPAQSLYLQGQGRSLSLMTARSAPPSPGSASGSVAGSMGGATGYVFRSPLFRVGRAPLLRVFVPSPEGDWLSDSSVLRCEAELRNAGVLGLMRIGDVIWDIAVGDEGNVGRLVWDGSYLIDLDYTYSTVGDLPKYVHALAFPPSYFHKVIRTGPANGNPVVHIDISPWGEEIAMNLQLLQDRIRTETPQGAYHNVVRWVNRSSFVIMPPSVRGGPLTAYTRARPHSSTYQTQRQATGKHGLQKSNSHSHALAQSYAAGPNTSQRLLIPGTDGMHVDPGWYGTVVVEAEGTNEGLADLQARCGPGVFPPRTGHMGSRNGGGNGIGESMRVFRILRERSRPGEIWIRTVREKERLL